MFAYSFGYHPEMVVTVVVSRRLDHDIYGAQMSVSGKTYIYFLHRGIDFLKTIL